MKKKKLLGKLIASYLTIGIILQPISYAAEVETQVSSVAVGDVDVTHAQNGITVVNIGKPNNSGLSYNRYNDLQVEAEGIIFNNRYGISKTELAGWIEGNPNLTNGSARIILNEVVGDMPTHLNGFMEIAGSRAALVIANENGISVDGAGFINASRGVITTGRPEFATEGSLSGFLVNKGNIEISGKGLDGHSTPMDILAETAKINAKIWANDLQIVAGKNTVLHNGETVQAISPLENMSTGVSLDVAAIGGMYADRIKLIGTDKGLGVNNHGIIAADNIHILQDGTICNKGTIVGNVANVEAAEISNLEDKVGISAMIAAADKLTMKADRINNEDNAMLFSDGVMTIDAGTLNNKEHAVIRSNSDMEINANDINNSSATIESAADVSISADKLNNTNAHFASELRVSNVENITEYAGSGSPIRYLAGTPNLWVYNDESDHLHTPSGSYEEWCRYNYTRTTENSVITETDPAQIYSAGNMVINAGIVKNDKSSIVSARKLDINADKLENLDFLATQKVHDSGSVTNFWRNHRRGTDDTGSSSSRYSPSDKYTYYEVVTTDLAADSEKELAGLRIEKQQTPQSECCYTAETNPEYADYKKWIVSDYMVNYLGVDVGALNRRLADVSTANSGIVGKAVTIKAGDAYNSGKISSNDGLEISINNLENAGSITGKNIIITADGDVLNNGGSIVAEKGISLDAQKNIINQAALTGNSNQTERHTNIYAKGRIETAGEDSAITMAAGNNISILGSVVKAEGNNASIVMKAQKVDVATVTENSNEYTLWTADNYRKTQTVEEKGSNLSAGSSIQIKADDTLHIKGSNISGADIDLAAENGVTVTAGRNKMTAEEAHHHKGTTGGGNAMDIMSFDSTELANAVDSSISGKNINIHSSKDVAVEGQIIAEKTVDVEAGGSVQLVAADEYAHQYHTEDIKKRGLLSSTNIGEVREVERKGLHSSTISGNSVNVRAGKDIGIEASAVVADDKVDLSAQGKIDIVSGTETGSDYYNRKEETSGIFARGFGLTIGRERIADNLKTANLEQVKSVVGSVNGSVEMTAVDSVTVRASDVIAAKDIKIEADDVSIGAGEDAYTNQEQHVYEKSGLSISVGGAAVNVANNVVKIGEKAIGAKDDRLKALYAAKLYETGKEAVDNLKGIKNAGDALAINVGIGTEKSESNLSSNKTMASGSEVSAKGDIAIIADKGNIEVAGSKISGQNVSLSAAENIKLEAVQNIDDTSFDSSSNSFGMGVSFGLAGKPVSVFGNMSQAGNTANESILTHTGTSIKADDTLKIAAGGDMDIVGSTASGDKVQMDIGGNLSIESLQKSKQYESDGYSVGAEIQSKIDTAHGTFAKLQGNGSGVMSSMESDYKTTVEQAGIYAGNEGFDINVGETTALKGAVIDSKAAAEKNRLSTGNLVYSDVENKAEYSAENIGAEFNSKQNLKGNTTEVKNTKGVTPVVDVPAKGEASGTTKSAIAEGTIEIRNNPDQDISDLSRTPGDALNVLGEIFDKQTVEEKQVMAKLFGEFAYRQIHIIAAKNGWDEGSPEKIALHAMVGGIMSNMTGAGFASGAAGAGLNEIVQKELAKLKDPSLHQIASGIIGAAAGSTAGAATAVSGTKNNFFALDEIKEIACKEIIQVCRAGTLHGFEKNADFMVLGFSRGTGFGGEARLIIDRFGTVYFTLGVGIEYGADFEYGMGIVSDSYRREFSSARLSDILSGTSGNASGKLGIGGGVSLTADKEHIILENVYAAGGAVSITASRTWVLFNIADIFEGE